MKCSHCKSEKDVKSNRIPNGWKRLDSGTLCRSCFGKSYVLRAPSLPIAKPIDMTWAEFRGLIRSQWQRFSEAATWMMRECYARDVRRESSMDKLPPMPRVYLYPEARAMFPEIPSRSVAALEQQVQAKYRSNRFKVIWTMEEQLQNLRYPQPFICPNQGWMVEIEDTDRRDMVVSVRVGDERIRLRLKSGKHFRRQRAMIEQMASGVAIQGELSIYRKRAQGDDRAGRNGQKSSAIGIERGESQHVKFDTMIKLVAYLPRQPHSERSETLYVRTDSDAMLVALNTKDERLWVLHADHVRRWTAEHIRRLNAWNDDSKAEQRPVPEFADRRTAACTKYRNRINSFEKEAASQLVRYAVRRRFAEIRYDDSDHSYLSRFDWSGLRQAIMSKCDLENIDFTVASGTVESNSRQSLATEV